MRMEKSLNRGYIVRFEHSLGFCQQKFMLICKRFIRDGTVCKWVFCFNDGRDSIENDSLVGRPVSVLMEKNVATVKTLIEEDECYPVKEIEKLSGIYSSSALKILMNNLGYVRSACAGCPICSLMSRNKVGLDLHNKL
jgi:hypothetical protein